MISLGVLLQAACTEEQYRIGEEHVLNRIGYGPDEWSRRRIRELGIGGYIEEQLRPKSLDDSQLEARLAARYPTLTQDYIELRHSYAPGIAPPSVPREELSMAKLTRALRSKRQLEQVLVDFWYNHFNVDASVEYSRWAAASYENDAIRPHVLGRFEDMLLAVAQHPAMLDYLNNSTNFTEGFRVGDRFYGPNENFAREILELHTLGVDAPYTLGDIQEVARAFTGWTFDEVLSRPAWGTEGFVYEDAGHDKGAKSILGGALQIPAGGGIRDGERVVHFLANHPLTAERVARKLCQRFIAEAPPEDLVQKAAQTFRASEGDLREVMRTILLSPTFRNGRFLRTKVKRPIVYLVSVARAVGVSDEGAWARAALLEARKMGESPYEAAPPTGYPEASSAWTGQGPFMRRVNYAYAAASGSEGFAEIEPLAGAPEEIADQLSRRLVWGGLSRAERSAVVSVVQGHNGATEVRHAAATVLVSPSFQLH